jgi:hypothetical protein
MTTSKVTRFRAYQLGASGSSFSYFVDGHFTVLEARMTEPLRGFVRQRAAHNQLGFRSLLGERAAGSAEAHQTADLGSAGLLAVLRKCEEVARYIAEIR